MINILLVLNVIVVILLIGIILLQKSEGGVLGMGGGGSKNGVLTARSAGNLITKVTYALGASFFVICILLAFLVARQSNTSKSFVDTMIEQSEGGNVKEVAVPNSNKIPEDAVKEEIRREEIKEKALKKPSVPTSN